MSDTIKNLGKVIILDWSIFLHRAVYSTRNNPQIPATFTAMSMILGNLKRIGVNPEDEILVACDGRRSWRKDFEAAYKANRKQKREDSGINWDAQFRRFEALLEEIDIATKWHVLKFDRIEADDIMIIASRYYKDREVILVTYDQDLEQAWHYSNVKIFSPMKKAWKIRPENFNAYKLISKKVQKETSDNLISSILSEEDYKTRMVCINLLELPEWVEKTVSNSIRALKSKVYRLEHISSKTIYKRMLTLETDKKDIIDYQKQVAKEEKKKLRQVKRKRCLGEAKKEVVKKEEILK